MNVIGSRADRWWNDPDRAMRRLVEELERFAEATGQAVTVVFDRRSAEPLPAAPGVRVVFARRGGRDAADREIVRLLAADPDPEAIRVVTSDRRLAERARDLGASVASSTSFAAHLPPPGPRPERPGPPGGRPEGGAGGAG